MSFGSASIWEIQTGGATTNGGSFNPAATMATDLATTTGNTSTPSVSSASYNFVAGDVGHWVFIQAGTNWIPGWYVIASVAANAATLTAGAGTGILYTSGARGFYTNTAVGCCTQATPGGNGTWSIDYSQSTTPYSYTDMVIGGTTTQFTSVAHPAGPNLVGNTINVTSGTGFTVQRVQVTAFTAAGLLATCDKSLGTTLSTGGNGVLGGPLLLVQTAGTINVAGNTISIKAGTYTSTTANTTVLGTTNLPVLVRGYNTLRGDAGPGGLTRPKLTTATNSINIFTGVNWTVYQDMALTSTAATKGNGVLGNTSMAISMIHCSGGLQSSPAGTPTEGLAALFSDSNHQTQCATFVNCFMAGTRGLYLGGSNAVVVRGCMFDTCSTAGIENTNDSAHQIIVSKSIFVSCVQAIYNNDSSVRNDQYFIADCVFDSNTNGFNCPTANQVMMSNLSVENCIFYNNSTAGITLTTSYPVILGNRNNAYGANGTPYTNWQAGPGDVTLSGDPFTSRSTRDYSLNNTAGAGAALRSVGWPGTFVGSATTGYEDIGPVRHQDAGSGPVGQQCQ